MISSQGEASGEATARSDPIMERLIHLLLSAFLVGTGLALRTLGPDLKLPSGTRRVGTFVREGLLDSFVDALCRHLNESKRLCSRQSSPYYSFTSIIE